MCTRPYRPSSLSTVLRCAVSCVSGLIVFPAAISSWASPQGNFFQLGIVVDDVARDAAFMLFCQTTYAVFFLFIYLDSVVKLKIFCYSLFTNSMEGLCKRIGDMIFLIGFGKF